MDGGADIISEICVMSGYQENDDKRLDPKTTFPDMEPIEPGGKKIDKSNVVKWLFFVFVIFCVLLSYYHPLILTHLGRYLVVKHPPRKSDLIVCLAGGNVERGLAAADTYQKGFSSRIFMAREELPDGYALLKERGLEYPESVDRLAVILRELGVPESALIRSERPAESTLDAAKIVRDFVREGDYRSFILITSPTSSRRAWLTFKKVFEEEEVRILVLPSPYSKFSPDDWWKKRKYKQAVIIEYEKLIYYAFKYFL